MPIFINSFLGKEKYVYDNGDTCSYNVKYFLNTLTGIPIDTLHISQGGRKVKDSSIIANGSTVTVYLPLLGGKGGFGSMLRAIGAQIEKTTNREACRDLSGRRLRDINEEKRLKQWLTKQKERDAEAAQKKQEKLEKIRQEPKHKFHDPDYDKFRSELTEKISTAVEEGLKKEIIVKESYKRKPEPEVTKSAKKQCMWLGMEDLDVSGSSSEDEPMSNEENLEEKKIETDENQFDINQYQSVKDLEDKLGNEGIVEILKSLGLKTGGTIEEKAQRLWAVVTGKKDKVNSQKLACK